MANDTDELSPFGSPPLKALPPVKTTPREGDREAIVALRALKPRRRAVLRVEMDPDNVAAAVDVKAALAGVSRKTYTRILHRGDVQAAMQAMIRRMLSPMVPAVIAAAARSARLEGREGYQDRKLLLGLAGLQVETTRKVEHSGAVLVKHGVGGALQRALSASNEAREDRALGSSGERMIDVTPTAQADEPESDTMPIEFEG